MYVISVWYADTYVPEKSAACIFRGEEALKLEMDVADSFKVVIFINQNTRCPILEDRNLKVTVASTSYPPHSHCLITNYSSTYITVDIVCVSQVRCMNDGYHYKACNI
jgi:plasmid rolling circle replication initiator protein Rep